jgi:site-specific DNA-adenine methylase
MYTILEEAVKKLKFQWYPNSYIPYSLFFSTQKEYDTNSLFPHFGSGKYKTFVDVFFSTGNFYFFLNLEKNVINIPNLQVFAFYKCIQKGYADKLYFSINLLPYSDDIKDKFEDCKKELNKVLR